MAHAGYGVISGMFIYVQLQLWLFPVVCFAAVFCVVTQRSFRWCCCLISKDMNSTESIFSDFRSEKNTTSHSIGGPRRTKSQSNKAKKQFHRNLTRAYKDFLKSPKRTAQVSFNRKRSACHVSRKAVSLGRGGKKGVYISILLWGYPLSTYVKMSKIYCYCPVEGKNYWFTIELQNHKVNNSDWEPHFFSLYHSFLLRQSEPPVSKNLIFWGLVTNTICKKNKYKA